MSAGPTMPCRRNLAVRIALAVLLALPGVVRAQTPSPSPTAAAQDPVLYTENRATPRRSAIAVRPTPRRISSTLTSSGTQTMQSD